MSDMIQNWHVYSAGSPENQPILFLHGFMGSGKIWLPTFEQLESDFYCVALDLPGHGTTEANLDKLTFDSLAESLADYIESTFSRPPIVVGYSMGGRIALYTALKYPDSVASLVMESSTAGIADGYERKKRLMQDTNLAEILKKSEMRQFLIDWYEQPVFAYLAKHPGLVERIIDKKSHGNPQSLAQVMVKLSPGNQPPLWDKLGQWIKPTLIIAGSIDAKYFEIGQRLREKLNNARLEVIEGAGHIVHLEKHKEFMSVLKSFLS
ncbi:MAG: 2-succinyl-6-hydroxy-2,4-cyclohexadiene-1-carboxylate synthase [Candidatus Zixiibacteriota bacterium]